MRKLIPLIAALSIFGLFSATALAHPLGNFTINHYARLEISPDQVRVRYVLDYAEIPTFQEKLLMDADADGTISDAERAAYLSARAPRLEQGLQLFVNEGPILLRVEPDSARIEFLPGQGGLEVMRLSMWLEAPLTFTGRDTFRFRDDNYKDRLGWREIVVPGSSTISIENSNVPAVETSHELTIYPENLLNSPRNDREAVFTVVPAAAGIGGTNATLPPTTGALGALDRTREEFGKLLTTNQELSPIVLLASFLVAIGLGALHAFSPGHGKAVVGAYLVGSRGNWQHAVLLGAVVTLTHTAGVYALGFVTLFLSAYVLPEQLFPWLGFVSGALVAIIGIQLFVQRLNAARARSTSFDTAMKHVHARDNGHVHAHTYKDDPTPEHAQEHAHSQEHNHEHTPGHVRVHAEGTAHSHSHAHEPIAHAHSHDFATPEEEQAHAQAHATELEAIEKPSYRNLISLGISGGLLPCPSALVVMLSAIALGRIPYGLFLIIGFSLGLAGVLVLTGLALLYAGKYAGRMFGGRRVGTFMRYVPLVGAFFVALLGIGIALDAFLQTGLIP